ncbi:MULTISPECIES: hypothetical protein [unclassified Streptomyces]|uniref:hypothetical protein n=1 Tax=unclassified Streptomyces TaxID=2593676 RepID=UPI00333077A3
MEETWTADEYGCSHAGHIGALLEDGTVPDPPCFDSSSGRDGKRVNHGSVYDGRWPRGNPFGTLRLDMDKTLELGLRATEPADAASHRGPAS